MEHDYSVEKFLGEFGVSLDTYIEALRFTCRTRRRRTRSIPVDNFHLDEKLLNTLTEDKLNPIKLVDIPILCGWSGANPLKYGLRICSLIFFESIDWCSSDNLLPSNINGWSELHNKWRKDVVYKTSHGLDIRNITIRKQGFNEMPVDKDTPFDESLL